jgi:hypothetical protein
MLQSPERANVLIDWINTELTNCLQKKKGTRDGLHLHLEPPLTTSN